MHLKLVELFASGMRIEHIDHVHEPLIGLDQVQVLQLLGEAHGCGMPPFRRASQLPLYCSRCNAQAIALFRRH